MSRIRVGLTPDAWRDEGAAVARFHGSPQFGTRGQALVGGTNRPIPNVIRANLRTPESASSKVARLRRERAASVDRVSQTNPDNGAVEASIHRGSL